MNKDVKFWNRIADRYAKTPVPDASVYQRKLEIIRGLAGLKTRILEFGCGTGSTALALAPTVSTILATDIAPKMIDIARRKADREHVDNVAFENAEIGEIATLEKNEGQFDVVLGMSILHLVADRRQALQHVHRLLNPGGYFISSTPCIADFMKMFKFIGPIGHALGLFPKVHIFGREELIADLRHAGLIVCSEWQPENSKSKGLFIVSQKPARADTLTTDQGQKEAMAT